MNFILFGSIILLSLVHQSVQLKCYLCGSFVEPATSSVACPEDDYDGLKSTCETSVGELCFKVTVPGNASTAYHGCQSPELCTFFTIFAEMTDTELDCKTCEDDLCNTASNLGASLFLLASTITASVCVVRS